MLASVIKDGGDDPDVTHGLEIYSKVSLRNDSKINIFGGIGVGKVTKKRAACCTRKFSNKSCAFKNDKGNSGRDVT